MPPRSMSALEIPTDRPDFLSVGSRAGLPPPASAVPSVTPPSEKRTSRPLCSHVYLNLTPDPELLLESRRYAYAYITPAPAPASGKGKCRTRIRTGTRCPGPATPEPFVRAAMRAAGLDLDFEARRSCYGDLGMRFRSPEDREVAMGKQPFALDGGSVKLVREGETPNVTRVTHDHLAHVVLRDYPVEQRTDEDIRSSCSGFGFIQEIDPACFAAPDLSPVHLVVNLAGLEQARQIPREVRIEYWMYGLRSVVPVEILRVWYRSESLDANGRYVPLFGKPPSRRSRGMIGSSSVRGVDHNTTDWTHADAAYHCIRNSGYKLLVRDHSCRCGLWLWLHEMEQ